MVKHEVCKGIWVWSQVREDKKEPECPWLSMKSALTVYSGYLDEIALSDDWSFFSF